MRAARILALVAVIYAGIVTAFEGMIGASQPTGGSTVVITTFDDQGQEHDRVVSRLETDGKVYVAANHWPRAWYRRALANPDVQVKSDGRERDYRAIPVEGEEHDRVESEHPRSLVFRILTGFPPRYFLRLDPR
jgi:hypothetical protein